MAFHQQLISLPWALVAIALAAALTAILTGLSTTRRNSLRSGLVLGTATMWFAYAAYELTFHALGTKSLGTNTYAGAFIVPVLYLALLLGTLAFLSSLFAECRARRTA